jgi:phage-related protein (TIGR01555 family)
MTVAPSVIARMRALQVQRPEMAFGLPQVPAGVIPERIYSGRGSYQSRETFVLAMDEAYEPRATFLNQAFAGQGFLGYAFLSELTQRAEYRAMSERVAFEMVRKWVRLKSASDQDKTDEIAIIDKKLKEFKVRQLFRIAAIHDGFFGRGQLYVKIAGASKSQKELGSPLLLSRYKIAKGSLKGFKIIEPIVTFPYEYNSSDALADDYYVPRSWFVLGQKVHTSRLLTFVSRPMPDLMKPAYNFGGMSMSQLGMDTVNNWLSTRSSVNQMIRSYSTSGFKTKMGDALTGGSGDDMLNRIELFVEGRDNQGAMILDKDEEFFQYNTPLSELSKLQAQAQEHMAAIAHTPLIILTGISPSGLNASSEGEIRVFYDYIHDMQEAIFRENLETVIRLIQMSEFQSIDDDITFEFEPLMEPDVEKLARIRKSDADACAEYEALGAVSAMEVRKKLAKDPESGFEGLNVDDPVPDVDPAIELKKAPLLAAAQGLKNPTGFMG